MEQSITLNAQDIVKEVILREIKNIIYSKDVDVVKSPYVKFVMIATAIEFLGGGGDTHEYTEPKLSEERFNRALDSYFPEKYKSFAKEGSSIYLYHDFRCPMVHHFRPSSKVVLTERHKGYTHLDTKKTEGKVYLVLEDFYDDLEKAAKKFLDACEKGKISNVAKTKEPFLSIDNNSTGKTESITVEVKREETNS